MEPSLQPRREATLEISQLGSEGESDLSACIPSSLIGNEINELSNRTAGQANERMQQLLASGLESLLAERQQEAIQIFQKVERLIDYLVKMDQEVELPLKIVCYYNLSCLYQQYSRFNSRQWILDSCCHYLDRCINAMEVLEQEGQTSIKRSTLLVQSILQYCAVLSQSGDHLRALETAKKAIPLLKKVFSHSYELCHAALRDMGSESEGPQKKIVFGSQVLRSAMEYLVELHNIPTYPQMNEANTEELESIRERIYFWRNNPENNQKLIRRELRVEQSEDATENRNLLGLQSGDSWIATHNIGTIMHMKPLHYDQYTQEDVFMFEMSKRKLLERAMLTSVGYFSLSTQLRFIELEKAKQENRNSSLLDKYALNEQVKTSEIFHLKAIQVICKFVKQNSVYVNHLIASYHKHYKQNLLVITEEPSMIEYSFAQQPLKYTESDKAEGSTSDVLNVPPLPAAISKKGIGYQPFKKREPQKEGANLASAHLRMKAAFADLHQSNQNRGIKAKLISRSKEKSIPSLTGQEASKTTKRAEQSSKMCSQRDFSGRLKLFSSHHRSSKHLQVSSRQESQTPRAKSKSHRKHSSKKDLMKRSFKGNTPGEKNILIRQDYSEEASNKPFERITSKNMEFLSNHLKSPKTNTISLTKKAFKMPGAKPNFEIVSIDTAGMSHR